MTVALGSAGNNFILGGKVANLSAEDAYTVRTIPPVEVPRYQWVLSQLIAFDHTRVWQGRCLRLPKRETHGTEKIYESRPLHG